MPLEFDIIRPINDPLAAPKPAEPVILPVEQPDAQEEPYILSEELATAVNVALAVDQPLLVTGEPGSGKTRLAWAIARQLGTRVLEFHTKSTSTARDLFYSFDTLRRFHDASSRLPIARYPVEYVTYQALGMAFDSDTTSVVLIDEIDKAPRDFPNDLLNELDRKEFWVNEISPPLRVARKVRQLVLITSNGERPLPAPFLRRCAFAHIPFPDADALEKMLAAHTRKLAPSQGFIKAAVKRFLELRNVEGLSRRPATGELIAWARVLVRMGVPEKTLAAPLPAPIPALEALVKTREDLALVLGDRK